METRRMKLRISKLNPHITCGICEGYLIEAATITECLHSFCKSCLVKYFETSHQCPKCHVMIHETQPLYHVRLDRVLQDVVCKLVPRLEKEEKKRERKFYRSRGYAYPLKAPVPGKPSPLDAKVTLIRKVVKKAQKVPDDTQKDVIHRDNQQISLQLEMKRRSQRKEGVLPLGKKFIRCSSQVTIEVLQKFISKKLEIGPEAKVEMLCENNKLKGEYTLYHVSDAVARLKDIKTPLLIHYEIIR